MTRRELREQTFKMLFGAGFHEAEDKEEALLNYLDETYEYKIEFFEKKKIIDRVLDIDKNVPVLDEKINSVAEGWKTSRMGKAELNIIRLALYEMLNDETVPVRVAINEAIELSKEYGGDDAPAFVNGILAKLVVKEGLEL